jgi:2-polyprenyl-3-methyl-5-hydroxy-6-metoxy-1,4-benzoquinol methylase
MRAVSEAEHGSPKSEGYFEVVNASVLRRIPEDATLFLDVGCASGRLGEAIKELRAGSSVHGIELDPSAIELASKRLDRIFELDLNHPLPELEGPYHCITCCDVLEHVADPWRLLRSLTSQLAPGGQLLASIPNIRFFPVLFDLVWKGRFTYRESGVLDATHLRFFTLFEMRKLFESAGLEVIDTQPLIDRKTLRKVPDWCRRWLEEFRATQYVLVGRRLDPSACGGPGGDLTRSGT